jgi:hypothetical protein
MLTTLKYEIIKRPGISVHIAEYLNDDDDDDDYIFVNCNWVATRWQ